MSEFTQNRGQGLLMMLRITVEACAAFFITAALMHYGVTCSRIGEWFSSLQLVPAAIALTLPVLAFWLGVTMIFGRVYCSSVCPLGALLDLFSRLRPKSKVYSYKRPVNALRTLSAVVCIAMLASGLLFPRQWFEPFGLYTSIVENLTARSVSLAAFISAAVVGTLAFMALRRGRMFCNTLCPIGALLGYFARRSAFHIDIDTDRCIQCRKCADVC